VGDLVSDRFVADQFAENAAGVDFSGALDLAYPAVSTVAVMAEGASLGNSFKATFGDLVLVVEQRLADVVTVADVFAQVDAELAVGPR